MVVEQVAKKYRHAKQKHKNSVAAQVPERKLIRALEDEGSNE